MSFVNRRKVKLKFCRIVGIEHFDPSDDPENSEFIFQKEYFLKEVWPALTEEEKEKMAKHPPPFTMEGGNNDIDRIVHAALTRIGIEKRLFYKLSTSRMGFFPAKKVLESANIPISKIDRIIGGTNTGPNYPSLADFVKRDLQEYFGEECRAECSDNTEACTTGSTAFIEGCEAIWSGDAELVLIIISEKATTLSIKKNWLGNLFSDGAVAILLEASDNPEDECVEGFEIDSRPEDGMIDWVKKVAALGFLQDGQKVHKKIGGFLTEVVYQFLIKLGLLDFITDIVGHQASRKTVNLFYDELKKKWPSCKATFHKDIHLDLSDPRFHDAIHQDKDNPDNEWFVGNTSSVSTWQLISKKIKQGVIKKGALILIVTFGSGFSYGMKVIRNPLGIE